MTLGSWLLISLIYWWFGRVRTETALLVIEKRKGKMLLVPRWIFFLCGAPKNKEVKERILSMDGLGMQAGSIILAITGIFLTLTDLSLNLSFLPSLIGTLALSLLLSLIAIRFWRYED